MSYKDVYKKNILKEYKKLKKAFFKNQFSHTKVITINLHPQKYIVLIDPGFGLTIVASRGDIKIVDYLLNQDYYDFGVTFSYYFVGEIMTFSQSDYTLSIYRKKVDSYFEDPTIKELEMISLIIDALYPILKYYNDNLATVDENVNFNFDFNDETREVSLQSYYFHKYEYYFGQNKLKTEIKALPDGDYLTMIDMVPMELPIFYSERKKLINPYILTIYNEGCHKRRLYLIPEEKNKAYEKAIQIINANEIGSHLCITNSLLHQAIKNMNNDLYNLTFEPLQYFRFNDLSVIEYNFYNAFASKDHFFIDYDILTEFFDNLNKCFDFIDENFDGDSYDESLFKSLNPDIYNFFTKYIANLDDDFVLFENCLLSNQLFGNLYPYTELLKLEDLDENNDENQDDDFELTDTTFAS